MIKICVVYLRDFPSLTFLFLSTDPLSFFLDPLVSDSLVSKANSTWHSSLNSFLNCFRWLVFEFAFPHSQDNLYLLDMIFGIGR